MKYIFGLHNFNYKLYHLQREKSKKVANPILTTAVNELIPNYKMKPELISVVVVIVLRHSFLDCHQCPILQTAILEVYFSARGSILEINID